MKRFCLASLVFFVIFQITFCYSVPNTAEESQVQQEPYNVQNSQLANRTFNHKNDTPAWVEHYLQGGIPQLETLPQYVSRYVFVAESYGSNLTALNQWASLFDADQDLAPMAAKRIQARLYKAASGNPDRVFGQYFESTSRLAADTKIKGGQKEGEFWLEVQPETGQINKEYVYFILITIEKSILQNQITPILNKTKVTVREQQTAIDKMLPSFHDGF